MTNPFVPSKRANIAIVAGNIDEETYKNLEALNLRVIKTIAHKGVYDSIKYHPDIVMHPIDEKLLIIEPTVFDYYKDQLKNTGIEVIKGQKLLESKYPSNIAYNVGRIGNYALHDFRHTDEKLKYHLQKRNIKPINLKQGYTKCSMALVGREGVITSDPVIDKKIRGIGFKSLLIKAGYIYLENQDYGFIGGCSGNISNRELLLSGSLKEHPDKEKIEKFVKDMDKDMLYLSKGQIEDIGTIITLSGYST